MPEPDKWVEYGKAGGECDKLRELLVEKEKCERCDGGLVTTNTSNDKRISYDTTQCGKCNGSGWINSRDHVTGCVDADPCECTKIERLRNAYHASFELAKEYLAEIERLRNALAISIETTKLNIAEIRRLEAEVGRAETMK